MKDFRTNSSINETTKIHLLVQTINKNMSWLNDHYSHLKDIKILKQI